MAYVLHTTRLRLRPFADTDAQSMYELNSDVEVMRYTGDTAFANIEGAAAVVAYVQAQYKAYGMGRLVVELAQTGEMIGWCGLKYLTEEKTVDIGYRFFRQYWGQGYGYEAAKVCFDHGCNTLQLKHIIGRAVQENMGSVKILERLGMRYTCDEPETDLVFGVYEWGQKEHGA